MDTPNSECGASGQRGRRGCDVTGVGSVSGNRQSSSGRGAFSPRINGHLLAGTVFGRYFTRSNIGKSFGWPGSGPALPKRGKEEPSTSVSPVPFHCSHVSLCLVVGRASTFASFFLPRLSSSLVVDSPRSPRRLLSMSGHIGGRLWVSGPLSTKNGSCYRGTTIRL